MNFRNQQKGHRRTISAKYQYNLASGFREHFDIDDARRRTTTDDDARRKTHRLTPMSRAQIS